MVDAKAIKEHATVVGLDGKHVGTVDCLVEGAEIKLTKNDETAGGLHHYIPLDFVHTVEGDTVTLNKPAAEVMREWSTT